MLKMRINLMFCVLGTTIGFSGCLASTQQAIRDKDSDKSSAATETPKSTSEGGKDDGDLGSGKGIFQSNRLRGTWSSEAADIEKSLGVGR